MNSTNWLPIRYRDFYDVPRAIVVEYREVIYFLSCTFDDAIDDYPDHFTVYLLPEGAKDWIEDLSDWSELPEKGVRVGTVRVVDTHFDDTKRKFIDESFFDFLN